MACAMLFQSDVPLACIFEILCSDHHLWVCRYQASCRSESALQSGSCSPTLESWLTGLSVPAVDAADFDIHLRLLLACNTCLHQVRLVDCEQALQCLGSSCCDAMHSTASSPHDAAPDSTQAPTSSHMPATQLTADVIAELDATSCQLSAVLKALQSGLHGAELQS